LDRSILQQSVDYFITTISAHVPLFVISLYIVLGANIANGYCLYRLNINSHTSEEQKILLLNTRPKRLIHACTSRAASLAALIAIIFIGVTTTWFIGAFTIWSMYYWWGIPYAIGLAFGLYVLRSKQRFIYGSIEVIVGIAAISTTIFGQSPSPGLALLVAVSSGIYIIVRGLDNIDNGLSNPEQKLPAWLYPVIERNWRRWVKF
jgi:hypothetical protein